MPPPPADVDPADKAAATAGLTNLRNALLPDGSLSARFTTTAGPDLKKVSGTVYVGAPAGSTDNRVLWVRLEDTMHPTVYTLWRNPGIVPLLHTPGFVVEKIQGGADLMTPGLQNGPPFPQKAKKGAVVAVASLENPTVPVAVGVCEIDVSALQQVQGLKGHAVRSVHWAGDEIWAWSTSGKEGTPPPEHLDGWYDENAEVEAVADQLEGTDLKDVEDGGVQLEPQVPAEGADGETVSKEEKFEYAEDQELTTKGSPAFCQSSAEHELIMRRNRRGVQEGLHLWSLPTHGDQQERVQLWSLLSAFSILRHGQPRPTIPPRIHTQANLLSPNKEDILQKH